MKPEHSGTCASCREWTTKFGSIASENARRFWRFCRVNGEPSEDDDTCFEWTKRED